MKRSGPPRRRKALGSRRVGLERSYYQEQRARRWAIAGGRCEADGLHDPNCPRDLNSPVYGRDAVAHHVIERKHGGPDDAENLRIVWAPGGIGGCHGRIHAHPEEARELGLLDR